MTRIDPLSRRTVLGASALGGGVAALALLPGCSAPDPNDPVVQAKQRLTDQGFWCGDIDEKVDDLTTCAVLAWQKAGRRKVDGQLDDATMAALATPHPPARFTRQGHVLEVDLKLQLLRVVRDGKVLLTVHASTGDGRTAQVRGRAVSQVTPQGRFRLHEAGGDTIRNGLGEQHRPHAFLGPIALYGVDRLDRVRSASTGGGVAIPAAALDMLADAGHLEPGRLLLAQ